MTPDQKLAFDIGTRMLQIRKQLPEGWQLDVCLQPQNGLVRLVDHNGQDRYEDLHELGEHPPMVLVSMGLDRCLEIVERVRPDWMAR